jgi:hypothetical protein
MQSLSPNPIFVKIAENLATDDILDDLTVEEVDIRVGDTINIGGRSYTVHPIKDDKGNLSLKNSDLKKNIKAFEELTRLGVIQDYRIDDLCLVNNYNGDVLIEVTVPKNPYEKEHYNHLLHSNQRSFFVRFDDSMLNPKLRDKKIEFEDVEIKLTPCMFASDSALAITESGKKISITERNKQVEERIVDLITNTRFTLYEREIVSRLVGAVNLLAYNKKINKVTTALPRGAYYSFLLQAYFDGFVTPEMVLDWFDRVDKRVKHLRLLIKKGIHQNHPALKIEQYSFMDSACGVMRAYFKNLRQHPEKGSYQELLDSVIDTILEKDSFAKQIFDLGIDRPTTFTDLANFTYSVGNLTDMELRPDQTPKHKLILGVYDVSETLMWTVAKKIRNRSILEPRGLFNPNVPQNTAYDHLSFVSIMPTEHVIFDLSPEFVERYMGGFSRLYSVRHHALDEQLQKSILNNVTGE